MATTERDRNSRTSLLPMGVILVGFVLADLLKLWFSANLARALALFLGAICLGAMKKPQLSWQRIILTALGMSTFMLLFGILHDSLVAHWGKLPR